MFPVSFYEKLDPTYRQALEQLENQLSYEQNPRLHRETLTDSSSKLIQEFATNYLTPKELWQKLWELYDFDPNNRSRIFPTIIYHFAYDDYMKFDLHYKIIPNRKLINRHVKAEMYGHFNKSIEIEDLCFPHDLLEFYLYTYELNYTSKFFKIVYENVIHEFIDSHLPQKIIKKHFEMKKLYEKIISVEGDDEKWINAMKEVDDNEFVKQNIEYKLGQDLTNKKLWVLYIKYLKEYDIQELLQTYSKYCRFFVDDISMKEEYKKAAEKYGKPKVPWKNTFDFEIFDETLLNIKYEDLSHDRPPKLPKKHIPLSILFNAKEIAQQQFPFHANFMDYLVKNAKTNELQKLNFSCKYFLNQYRIPICYHLFVLCSGPAWNSYDFREESLIFHSDTLEEINFNNIYISTKFFHRHSKISLNNLIPKIYKCDAKYIDITSQKLSNEEFKFFVGHGNVIDLRFCRLTIIGADGERLPMEDILALTPKLQYLIAFEAFCSPITAEKLCEIPFKNKFLTFELWNGTNFPLNPNFFGEFINKNASPYSRITFNSVDENFVSIVQSVIDGFWKTKHKPDFSKYGFP